MQNRGCCNFYDLTTLLKLFWLLKNYNIFKLLLEPVQLGIYLSLVPHRTWNTSRWFFYFELLKSFGKWTRALSSAISQCSLTSSAQMSASRHCICINSSLSVYRSCSYQWTFTTTRWFIGMRTQLFLLKNSMIPPSTRPPPRSKCWVFSPSKEPSFFKI